MNNRSMALLVAVLLLIPFVFSESVLWADGKVVPPRDYEGSLEETSQEAIIVFLQGNSGRSNSIEHLILKIRVEGDAEQFAWVIPLPNEPTVKKENAELFKDCFDYVQTRKRRMKSSGWKNKSDSAAESKSDDGVEVLSRKIVGDFDIAVVRENSENSLNTWLDQEGFQTLDDAEDVLEFYREKKYVYTCIKVSSEALASNKSIESHPLRFTFETGGQDGIFFPMKLTGLQEDKFDVNLYVFYQAWLNKNLNKFGFENRGFELNWRDVDSAQCESNAGKNYSNPGSDPYLKNQKQRLGSVKTLMQKIAPGERFYMTNIQANDLNPQDVRDWSDDLWLFPHYVDKNKVPADVLNGPASAAWPNEPSETHFAQTVRGEANRPVLVVFNIARILLVLGIFVVLAGLIFWKRKSKQKQIAQKPVKPSKPIDF